jgi:uncharacterized protein YkwD
MLKKLLIAMVIALFLCVALFEFMFQDRVQNWFSDEEDQIVFNQIDITELAEELILSPEEETDESVEEEKEIVAEPGAEETIEPSLDDSLIGMQTSDIVQEYGEPTRKDPSSFGYEWWAYENSQYYTLIGVEDDEVVTAFLTWSSLDDRKTILGESYETLNEQYDFSRQVELQIDSNQYQFQLTEQDVRMRPLVKVGDVWMQLYFDVHTNELSSIRYLTDELLVKQRPYSISYRGSLLEVEEYTEEEWREIEEGQERQIFYFTNVLRDRHELEPLEWSEEVSEVAYMHSLDMESSQYFSHTSPNYGELSDRFDRGEVQYRLAGENIAAKYVDGLAATEGWLNSEGHRVNVLHTEFSELGVGVYRDFYTQNFMTPFGF